MVALTFDDGPDPRWTPLVLDALDAAGAPATFFVVAEQIEDGGGAELIAETLRRGHSVQMHCARHVRHEQLDLAGLRADARHVEAALRDAGAPEPWLWRPPYGSVNDPHSCTVAAEHGRQLVRWTHDPRDYRDLSAAAMLEQARAALAGGATVILLHDSRRYASTSTRAQNTVELICPLVEHVRASGSELTALREPLACRAPAADGERFLLPCR